jgi:hypothetical protein
VASFIARELLSPRAGQARNPARGTWLERLVLVLGIPPAHFERPVDMFNRELLGAFAVPRLKGGDQLTVFRVRFLTPSGCGESAGPESFEDIANVI